MLFGFICLSFALSINIISTILFSKISPFFLFHIHLYFMPFFGIPPHFFALLSPSLCIPPFSTYVALQLSTLDRKFIFKNAIISQHTTRRAGFYSKTYNCLICALLKFRASIEMRDPDQKNYM